MTVQVNAESFLAEAVEKPLPERPLALSLALEERGRGHARGPEPDDTRYILGPGPEAVFMSRAMKERLKLFPPAFLPVSWHE